MHTSDDRVDRILVVDDDAVMREVLSLLIAGAGYDVLTAESGTAALELLSTLSPDRGPATLLVDLKMPGISPSALAVRLRGACPGALLVAMSGSHPSAEERAAFDAFLLKPFTVPDIDTTIRQAGQRSAANAQPEKRPRKPAIAPAGGVIDEVIYAKLAAVMGHAQLPQLYGMFLDDAPTRLDRMETAVAEGDEVTFVREAHTLKGGCGMLGATELQALAERAEAGGLAVAHLLDDFQPAIDRLRSILNQHSNLRT